MMISESQHEKYLTRFTNGMLSAYADTTKNKGGLEQGFRPHELLEAALACCMNMSLRMNAEKLCIPLKEMKVQVSLNRENSEQSTFEYSVSFGESLLYEDEQKLLTALEYSSVRSTLSKPLAFKLINEKANL
ncbi:hypothetical protein SJPD1_0919 [Sulfurospirillum diekertiae]|uniref:OsmC-like protein n=1 Tax=Sulfurospirillum diekertiae TaxID=1854492 RepID=A0A290HBV4_9BACT|nr:OsmC family protein [Sulfurospirillum diekertiae]ATB69032.1 hypothetical protein SJPD1_0919 [Sulfurospirillum diekertiae]